VEIVESLRSEVESIMLTGVSGMLDADDEGKG
jgi:hypothetical protein